jgi:SMI1 / KNR4 family (SUKH-1)
MTSHEFQDFVAANIDWFRGRLPETDASLQEAEELLRVQLPNSLKWLLKQHGYWHGTSISSLRDAIETTLRWRRHALLPARFVVLEDFEDAGAILVDTGEMTASGESPLYWVGMEDVGNPPRLEGNTRFDSFGDYVKAQLPSVQDHIKARFVRYDPRDFPEGRGDSE